MNDEPTKSAVDPVTELRRSHESLRTLFQLAVLCGIVLSMSVSFLVFKQVAAMRRQSLGLQTMIDDHNTNWIPRLHIARTNLEAYAIKDPTLAPIVQKYFATNQPARSTPPPTR